MSENLTSVFYIKADLLTFNLSQNQVAQRNEDGKIQIWTSKIHKFHI